MENLRENSGVLRDLILVRIECVFSGKSIDEIVILFRSLRKLWVTISVLYNDKDREKEKYVLLP